MLLYKIEIECEDGKGLQLIVAAESDETAFDYVEGHLARHFTVSPAVKSATIVEKKRIGAGAGYVIEA